jgi:hypothetical protein
MQSLNGLTAPNEVVYHVFLSVLPIHIRDIFAWKNLKKWGVGRIHRIFLSFHPVSIAIISNHHETVLIRF